MAATSPLPAAFESGSTFGEYTIVRRIGRGGQGSVYEVTDSLGLTWALKVSDEMDLSDPQAEVRFAREARCVAENLSEIPRNVGILIGEHYGVWARRFYIKMKLLQGESLAQRLRRVGQLSIYEAVKLFERVAFAVGHAHEHGVLHRDLKPENIFITTREEVVVLDWGCLQLIEAGQARTTLNGVICTPGYAPIEQYLATSIVTLKPAADIYSLGVMFYEALAGYHPFLNWSRAALNQERPKAAAPIVPRDPGTRRLDTRPLDTRPLDTWGLESGVVTNQSAVGTQTVVVPTTMLQQLHAQLDGAHAEPSPSVFTRGTTWKSNSSAPPASNDTANSWTLRTGATVQLPDSFAVSKAKSRSSAPPTRTIRPAGLQPETPHEQLAEPSPLRRDAPRRFSIVQVLALQERTLPQPISGLPAGLQKLLSSMLAKRPEARPQDALVLAQQLRLLLEGELKESPELFALSTPEQHGKYLARALWWSRLRQSSSRWGYAAAGFVFSALTGVAAYYGMSLTQAEPAPDPATITSLSVAASEQQPTAAVTYAPREASAVVLERPVDTQVVAADVTTPEAARDLGVAPPKATTTESEPGSRVPAKPRSLAQKETARKQAPKIPTPGTSKPLADAVGVHFTTSATVPSPIPVAQTPALQAPDDGARRLRGSPQARLPKSRTESDVLPARVQTERVAP